MAKLVKTYENDIEKTELTFRGETYDFSMIPTSYGSKGDKPTFEIQVAKKHPEYANDDDLIEVLAEISLDSGEDDIFRSLECLEYLEGGEG